MWVLLSLLVLAVGFVALGTLVDGLGVLSVFGVAFLGAAIAFLAKLLVVSHVHIRGTAGRLEALNDRYDQTSRWLEGFDADTRESFLAAGRRLDQADADRIELLGELEKLSKEAARLEAVAEIREAVAKLDAETGRRLKASDESLAVRTKELDEQLAGKLADLTERSASEIEKAVAASREQIDKRLAELRNEVEAISSLSTRLEEAESRIEAAEDAAEQAGSKVRETIDASLAEAREQFEDKLRLVNGRVSKVDDEHERKRQSAAEAVREQATSAIAELRKRLDDAARLSARQRGDGYVQFPRVVSGGAAEAIGKFGVKVTPAELKYLERKLQVLEGVCEGRLAGSIDDAIGRVLAGRLVRGKQIRVLEIGVLFGVGAAFMHHALASRFDKVHLSLLDPFEGYYGKDHLDPLTGLPVTRAAVERNMARCGIPESDYEILEGFSTDDAIRDAAEAGGPYHVIVIDGDHSADGIKADYERYAGLVRAGGTLVIDDYGSDDWPAVTDYVDSVVREDDRFKLVSVLGKSAVFKRGRSAASKKASARAAAGRSSEATKPAAATTAEAEANGSPKKSAGASKKKVQPRKRSATKSASSAAASKTGKAREDSSDDAPVPIVKTRKAKKKASRAAAQKADASADA